MRPYSLPGVTRHLVTSLTLVFSATWAQSAGTKTKPSDFFWQLQHLDKAIPTGNPSIGGQNFTYCCLKAVNQSLEVDGDGNLILLNDWIVLPDGNATHLLEADSRGQFPCGATYNGDPNGAPVVQVNYTWLADECPGWEQSNKKNLNAWLQPLSGFLLPAIIFCLSVPRRRKLYIFRAFFVADLAGVKSYVPALLGAIGALVLVTLDTIIWLSTCFALAGPMILSGLYEALLDNRILEFLRVKIHNQRLTLDMRCRCLMIILIGNLDLALDELEDEPLSAYDPLELTGFLSHESHSAVDNHDHGQYQQPTSEGRSSGLGASHSGTSRPREPADAPRSPTPPHITQNQLEPTGQLRNSLTSHVSPSIDISLVGTADIRREFTPIQRQGTTHLRASPWRHMEELLYGIRLFDDEEQTRNLSPRQWPKHKCASGPNCRNRGHVERPLPRTSKTERQVRKTKTRLRTMLHCQYSFGSIVGAPVIFFLGGFIFALLQSLEGLGDEDIAEGLAFGQWYMTIPHIAIVSGLLLAGNNPNILEGVFATERDEASDDFRILGLHFELAYPSCYKVAWQWLRGHTKKQWINKLIDTYETRYDFDYAGNRDRDSDIEYLRAMTTLSPLDWFLVLSLATLLLGVPFVLAFLTAFYTPEVGLWLWAYAGPPPRVSKRGYQVLNFFRRDGWLDRRGFYNPTSTRWLLGHSKHRTLRNVWSKAKQYPMKALWCFLWYFLTTLFGVSAIFTALGGTLMQLMGVYSADLCYVTVEHWTRPFDQRPKAIISSNSKDMIYYASVYWKPNAITAICFMTVVSFVGWWYQRRMRDMFGTLVRQIDLPEYDREETKDARPARPDAPYPVVTPSGRRGSQSEISAGETPRLGSAVLHG